MWIQREAGTPLPEPIQGNIVDSLTQVGVDPTTNAASLRITKEINDSLEQTPITVGGETLSTIDEKLNFLCEAKGIGKTIILTPIYNSSGPQTDILITTYGMGMISYFQTGGYSSSSPYVTDYFEVQPQNNRINVPIILKRGKWIDGEGVIYDTSNGNVNVNIIVDSSYRPQRRYSMFALLEA